MDACSIMTTERFQTKQKMSGISPVVLAATMSTFESKYGKEPELDLIPKANSEPYLREQLKIKDDTVDNNVLLNYTKANSLDDANIKLNNIFRDLNIKIIPVGNESVIEITKRPSKYIWKENNPVEVNKDITKQQSRVAMISMLDKLRKLFGIDINYLTQDELIDKFGTSIPEIHSAKGFVYEGQIYINTNNATIDSPIHELLHIFLGGMRFQDPILYENIVNSIEKLENYQALTKPFSTNRTRLDVNEEIFVDEFARYLTGEFNSIKEFSNDTLDQIFYNVNRILDSTLNGNYSVESVNPLELYNMNLLDLAELVQSSAFNPRYTGSLTDATIHRLVANQKSDLLSKGDLIEICE